jgi:hypothetical protein
MNQADETTKEQTNNEKCSEFRTAVAKKRSPLGSTVHEVTAPI